ncbi:MAG: hypothetical protein IJB52_11845 [Clostridia bacterium]|nr:hypothetical protein [Clostridia bacterium]
MTGKQYQQVFQTLTKCIFTVLTGQSALFLSRTYSLLTEPEFCFSAYRQIPLCLEHLGAGILLYVIMAAASALALREYGT